MRRFYYHFNRGTKKMSIHFKGKCTPVSHIECRVACETKYNKRQPLLVMQGFANNIEIIDNKAIIS